MLKEVMKVDREKAIEHLSGFVLKKKVARLLNLQQKLYTSSDLPQEKDAIDTSSTQQSPARKMSET